MGTPGPPELQEHLTDQAFWKELGWTREYRRSRPHREVADRMLIISMIRREEHARASRSRS